MIRPSFKRADRENLLRFDLRDNLRQLAAALFEPSVTRTRQLAVAEPQEMNVAFEHAKDGGSPVSRGLSLTPKFSVSNVTAIAMGSIPRSKKDNVDLGLPPCQG